MMDAIKAFHIWYCRLEISQNKPYDFSKSNQESFNTIEISDYNIDIENEPKFNQKNQNQANNAKRLNTKNSNSVKQNGEEETKKRQYKAWSHCGKKRHMKDSTCPMAVKKK